MPLFYTLPSRDEVAELETPLGAGGTGVASIEVLGPVEGRRNVAVLMRHLVDLVWSLTHNK